MEIQIGQLAINLNNGEVVVLNMNKALKYSRDTTDCFRVDMIDEVT